MISPKFNPDRLHIAIFVPSLDGGGAERAMVTLANSLSALGHKVDLICAKAFGKYIDEVSDDVSVLDFNRNHVLLCVGKLVKYLATERPDALISALTHTNIVAIISEFLAKSKTKLIVSERSNLKHSFGTKPTIRGRVLPLAARKLYPRADKIVAVSDGVADSIKNYFYIPRSRIDVIYNPVVTDSLSALAAASVVHPWLESQSPPLLLAVGRLTEAKDYPTLLRAFSLARKRVNCNLIILGEGEARPQLEAMILELGIADFVLLPGFCENPFAWMSKVDLYILSSAWEGLPNALIQAMACGADVISTNCDSGPAEILENGKWGTLVPIRNAHALADAIVDRLLHTNKSNSVERANYFSEQRAVERFLELIKN